MTMTVEQISSYSDSEFEDLALLMRQLTPTIRLERTHLDGMMADPNSRLYVVRDGERIVGCAAMCIFHQPFETDATIEAVTVLDSYRGRGIGRMLVEHIIAEARRMAPIHLHLTSHATRVAANMLYQSSGFSRKETNVYVMDIT